MAEHMQVQRIPSHPVQAGNPECSPGTATLAEAIITCHQQRCEMEPMPHPVLSLLSAFPITEDLTKSFQLTCSFSLLAIHSQNKGHRC